jgi:hypothetical protein
VTLLTRRERLSVKDASLTITGNKIPEKEGERNGRR